MRATESSGRSGLAGLTFYCAYIHPQGTILGLALLDNQYAAPGTEVTVVWGEDPSYHRIRATVQPAPYNEFARTQYRSNA